MFGLFCGFVFVCLVMLVFDVFFVLDGLCLWLFCVCF